MAAATTGIRIRLQDNLTHCEAQRRRVGKICLKHNLLILVIISHSSSSNYHNHGN
ncbi:hypothetical protein PAXINDRAFT_170072 [Paxillus involutus ATCC 200175]|uniref:Uncharacterized protein n=1 Tax=Paxillus involutus ATCC 200175 TaxID=664439 RepID=A0A0C9TUN9_PAXIN|nr:hypothetical protein PAXINDRAFT_170072 [Paxillus involutus ATCC 200175]